MVITPQVAVSYAEEYWNNAKPFEGWDLMNAQAVISYQSLLGMRHAFVEIHSEATVEKLKTEGFQVSRSAQSIHHVRW